MDFNPEEVRRSRHILQVIKNDPRKADIRIGVLTHYKSMAASNVDFNVIENVQNLIDDELNELNTLIVYIESIGLNGMGRALVDNDMVTCDETQKITTTLDDLEMPPEDRISAMDTLYRALLTVPDTINTHSDYIKQVYAHRVNESLSLIRGFWSKEEKQYDFAKKIKTSYILTRLITRNRIVLACKTHIVCKDNPLTEQTDLGPVEKLIVPWDQVLLEDKDYVKYLSLRLSLFAHAILGEKSMVVSFDKENKAQFDYVFNKLKEEDGYESEYYDTVESTEIYLVRVNAIQLDLALSTVAYMVSGIYNGIFLHRLMGRSGEQEKFDCNDILWTRIVRKYFVTTGDRMIVM